jgi:hypothetical protein
MIVRVMAGSSNYRYRYDRNRICGVGGALPRGSYFHSHALNNELVRCDNTTTCTSHAVINDCFHARVSKCSLFDVVFYTSAGLLPLAVKQTAKRTSEDVGSQRCLLRALPLHPSTSLHVRNHRRSFDSPTLLPVLLQHLTFACLWRKSSWVFR